MIYATGELIKERMVRGDRGTNRMLFYLTGMTHAGYDEHNQPIQTPVKSYSRILYMDEFNNLVDDIFEEVNGQGESEIKIAQRILGQKQRPQVSAFMQHHSVDHQLPAQNCYCICKDSDLPVMGLFGLAVHDIQHKKEELSLPSNIDIALDASLLGDTIDLLKLFKNVGTLSGFSTSWAGNLKPYITPNLNHNPHLHHFLQ